ncbi:hypothetical protein RvY_02220 [Ramazzottius varieornatus]|uniref:Receptor ligand binding region domain-containing protein n=1 Tax=Ramazzottius varieornatus TaxID=947166 RepID=A0A1D1UIZ5_RAMVA|nr:hypothetical protein RvY_02220 [Ramazzottius varieornatus]
MRDPMKHPTLMSTSVSENFVMQRFIKSVLLDFRWTTVFFLCDEGSPNSFYINNCKGLRSLLDHDPKFLVRAITVNTRPPSTLNYELVLPLIARQSRGACLSSLMPFQDVHKKVEIMDISQ